MKVKRFISRFGLGICAVVVTVISLTVLRTEKENNKDKTNNEQENEYNSAEGYINWRNQIIANQVTGTVDPAEVARINNEINANAGMDWTEVGPDNVGGRTRSILIDRTNHNIIFAGSVAGGIWKSVTAGASWTRVDDKMACLNIGCLTQTANGNIYAGTGEGNFGSPTAGTLAGSPGFDGIGVFMSIDGGTTFNLLPKTNAATAGQIIWANTNDIASDPVNANKIYAGNDGGLYISNDGGANWTKAVTNPAAGGKCLDIDVSKDGDVVAASIGSSIYISIDGGSTFNKLTPSNTIWGGTPNRVSLAIARSNSSYIYAMAANAANERTLSMVQSKDKGQTWTRIVTGSTPYVDILSNPSQGQGYWNNVTAVDPDDPEHVYFGGVGIWAWTPGAGISQIGDNNASTLSPRYVHSDNHVIVWDTKTTPATMYIGNDGGVFKSYDKGQTYSESNHGYNVTQFYGVAATYVSDDVKNAWVVAGGAQDNGTWEIDGLGNTKLSAVFAKGGDGFNAELSQKLPGYGIFSSQTSDLATYLKFTSRDQDFTDAYDHTFYDNRTLSYCTDSGIFNTPFVLWESTTPDSNSLFLFAARGVAWVAKNIYKDLSKTPVWYRLTNIAGQGTCVDISRDGNTAIIGTNAGVVYKVDSILTKGIFDSVNGTVGNINISVVHSASQYVTGVSFSKTDKNKVIITKGNYGNSNYVYYSTDFTSASPTFNSIQGNLPAVPVYDGEILWDDPKTLVLATEHGMFVSHDITVASPTYALENNGMANLPVFQIRQYKFNNWPGSRLYIATHGRGFFVSTTFAHTGVNAMRERRSTLNVFPNPAKITTTFSFNSKRSSKATISIYNLNGQLIKHEEITTTSGRNNYSFFVDTLQNGNYIVIVDHDGTRETQKLVVVK